MNINILFGFNNYYGFLESVVFLGLSCFLRLYVLLFFVFLLVLLLSFWDMILLVVLGICLGGLFWSG